MMVADLWCRLLGGDPTLPNHAIAPKIVNCIWPNWKIYLNMYKREVHGIVSAICMCVTTFCVNKLNILYFCDAHDNKGSHLREEFINLNCDHNS